MKKQAHILLVFTVLLATISTSVQAQSDRLISANVPFNFVIRDRALPAGEYVFALARFGGSDAIKIQSRDGHITAFVPVRSANVKANQDEPTLVFNRYQDQYFLARVYGLENASWKQLTTPRAEEQLARGATERCTVSIAARKR